MAIVVLEQDENGDLILPLTDEVCAELGWKAGDTVIWKDQGNGSFLIEKKNEEKQ